MEASMSTASLRDALIKAKPIKINKTLPVLSNARIDFNGNRGVITTSDLKRVIRVSFECKNDEPFSTLLPLRAAERFLHGANGNVSLQQGKDPKQLIMERDGVGQFTLIEATQPDDFPYHHEEDDLVWSKLDAKWFCPMIKLMATACDLEMSRPILSGVHFKDGAMASADGFRLMGLEDARLSFGLGNLEVILPNVTANLVARLFEQEESLEFAFKANGAKDITKVFFKSGNIWMSSDVIQGKYPNYKILIPDKYSSKVSFSAPVMVQRLGMIDDMNVSNGKTRFVFAENENTEQVCTITAGNKGYSRYSLTLPVKLETPEPSKIAFDCKYIKDALKLFSLVTLELTTTTSPGKFTGDIEGLTIVVMPMFIQW